MRRSIIAVHAVSLRTIFFPGVAAIAFAVLTEPSTVESSDLHATRKVAACANTFLNNAGLAWSLKEYSSKIASLSGQGAATAPHGVACPPQWLPVLLASPTPPHLLQPVESFPDNETVWCAAPGFAAGQAIGPGRLGVHFGLSYQQKRFPLAPNFPIEWDEWAMARALVTPADAVIEFGGRYGTTSCALAEATNNSGRVLSVEPDVRAHEALLTHRKRNRCNFAAYLGTVSAVPVALSGVARFHYDQRTHETRPSRALPNVSPARAAALLGANFTAVLIDCEGCIALVQRAGLLAAPSVTLVLLEEDILRHQYQKHWHVQLRALGYTRAWYAFSRTGTQDDRHSAWVRGGRPATSCSAFRDAHGIRKLDGLRCIEDDEATLPFAEWMSRQRNKPPPPLAAGGGRGGTRRGGRDDWDGQDGNGVQ